MIHRRREKTPSRSPELSSPTASSHRRYVHLHLHCNFHSIVRVGNWTDGTSCVLCIQVALAFPRELLAAASRELELANACGLYRRRGAVTGAVTGGGDTNRPQVGASRGSPNASTLAAARRMATGPGHEPVAAACRLPTLQTTSSGPGRWTRRS